MNRIKMPKTPMRLCEANMPLPGSFEAKYPSRESSGAIAAVLLEPFLSSGLSVNQMPGQFFVRRN
ncbi:hypothetical protein MY4824_002378 [Beauveria thailandica]